MTAARPANPASQAALARVAPQFGKPGVAFKIVGSIPLFRADPEHPSRLIREVNGKLSIGKLVNGQFKMVSTKR